MFASVTKRMKVLMVACMIIHAQGWGKYYLVKTEDAVSPHHHVSEAGVDYNDDVEDCQTENLIYKHFTESQLYELEHLSKDNKGELLESMDEVINNAQNGKDGNDYNLDIIEHIKEITHSSENLLKGITRLLRLLPSLPMPKYKYKKTRCNRKKGYGSDKSKESKRCMKTKSCKKSKESNKLKKPAKSTS